MRTRSFVVVAVACIAAAYALTQEAELAWLAPGESGSCITDGDNFIGCQNPQGVNGQWEALRVSNGSTLWTVGNPLAGGFTQIATCPQLPSVLFLIASNTGASGLVQPLNKATGAGGWTFYLDVSFPNNIAIQCSANGEFVFLVSPNNIYALKAATGALAWLHYVNTTQTYTITEVVVDGVSNLVFADTLGFHRIDTRSGGSLPFAQPIAGLTLSGVVGSVLLFSTSWCNLTAVDVKGNVLWTQPSVGLQWLQGGIVVTSPSSADNNKLWALNATTGEVNWKWTVGGHVPQVVAGAGDVIVLTVYSNLPNLYDRCIGVDVKTGATKWIRYNISSVYVQWAASANYVGLLSSTMGFVAFKIVDGTNRTLTLPEQYNMLSETETLLLIQNNTNVAAFRKW